MGISITIATGRDKGGIDFVYEPLELEHRGDNFVAGVNGQIIYDFHKRNIMWIRCWTAMTQRK